MQEQPPLWRVATNILNKQSEQPTRSNPPAWKFGELQTTPYCKNFTKISGLDFSFGLREVLWSVLLRKYNWDDKIKKGVGGASSTLREERYVPDLMGKSEGKWPLGRPECGWEYNIKMYLQGKVWRHGLDWCDRERWRVVMYGVMKFRVPCNEGNFLTIWRPVRFSGILLHAVS